jgi:hypothetical protein
MGSPLNSLRCDGCGFPASAEHIAMRLERLELATRFRPVHIRILFVRVAPNLAPLDDFYRAPESDDFFKSLLDTLGIQFPAERADPQPNQQEFHAGMLLEFQRRGYYLTYLSECPLESTIGGTARHAARNTNDLISSLGPTLAKRIQLNYRPKQIVLLAKELDLFRAILAEAGADGLLVLDGGEPLHLPGAGDLAGRGRFRAALNITTSSAANPRV